MQTSTSERAKELERVYQSRRGHVPQISISDESHHVTEAIGDMYGNDEYSRRDSRPLSFVSSPLENGPPPYLDSSRPSRPSPPSRSPLTLTSTVSNDRAPQLNGSGSPKVVSPRTPPLGHENGSLSPKLHRTPTDTAQQQFPISDIDYESSPAAVAKELSNLQAIRRMSMDVNASDPDLPNFGGFSMPAAAPSHSADEDDASTLFWVPARLHPELAPKEFKNFIEDRVSKIKRRSGGDGSLSPDSVEGSGGGLRRKKSMLSRQVDDANGYKDGAERLERRGSESTPPDGAATLHELEHLAEDPQSLMRRLSLETAQKTNGAEMEVPASVDMPILPPKPGGALKRSTRTNYRRGSLRKGERVPFSKRVHAARHSETDTETSPVSSPLTSKPASASTPDLPSFGLSRVQTEPIPASSGHFENFSRPSRRRSPPGAGSSVASSDTAAAQDNPSPTPESGRKSPPKTFHSRIASNGRTTAPIPGYSTPVPQIYETTPESQSRPIVASFQRPERKSSYEPPPSMANQLAPPRSQSARQPRDKTPVIRPPIPPVKPTNQTLDDMAAHPSPLPGNQSTRTDALSFIPTLPEEKRVEKKASKEKTSEGSTRKTSWGWLLGGEDKEKEKEREKERREKEEREVKKPKAKLQKTADKAHDNTRLDVLQASIDGTRPRESLVLNREDVKLEEERKKESRKASGDSKKEKESGLFSSLFGGGKKKGDRDSAGKKHSHRGLSPEPPPRVLRPDIDYNWTRFSILEERAIYRMAHIKLANPKRDLYSQVLLSNFMYSYLAKVQAMHPQIQIGQSATQKQQQRQAAQQKKAEQQPEEFVQYQKYMSQEQQQGNYDSLSAEPPADDDQPLRPDSRASQHPQAPQQSAHDSANGTGYSVSTGQNYLGRPGYYQQQLFDEAEPARDDEMW